MSSNDTNQPGKEFWTTQNYKPSKRKGNTRVKITIPSGDNFTLFNMAEISAPAGATVVLKLPFPMAEAGLSKMLESVRMSGGTVEILGE